MYRTVDAKFWHDPKVRKLSPDGKLLMLYLITNPHTHLCGLYYLPDAVVMHETGLTKSKLDTLCHRVSEAGLAYFDGTHEVVWVKNMFGYQGRGEKHDAAAAKQLETLADSDLTAKFLERYPHISDRVSHRVSAFGTPEQEQEQEQKKEQEQNRLPPSADVDLVIEHYRSYHEKARPGSRERKAVAARLKDGFTVNDLTVAIDGCHSSPFHCGQNERGQKYQSLELIVRNSDKVTQFIEAAGDAGKPKLSERTRRNLEAAAEFLGRSNGQS